jgi:anti-anti-sigma regulatory factor
MLRAEVANEDARAVVRLRGYVGGDEAAALVKLLGGVFDEGPERVVVDLRKVTQIDMRGVAALLAARNLSEERAVPLELIPGPPEVQANFVEAGIASIFAFVDATE